MQTQCKYRRETQDLQWKSSRSSVSVHWKKKNLRTSPSRGLEHTLDHPSFPWLSTRKGRGAPAVPLRPGGRVPSLWTGMGVGLAVHLSLSQSQVRSPGTPAREQNAKFTKTVEGRGRRNHSESNQWDGTAARRWEPTEPSPLLARRLPEPPGPGPSRPRNSPAGLRGLRGRA